MTRATAARLSTTILTTFAGDPRSTAPPGPHDRRCGFGSAGEAAARRREEDRRACARLGAIPKWLPFQDGQYRGGADDEEIWALIAPELREDDAILLPGFPLTQPDHVRLARLVSARWGGLACRGLYVEQPYASWQTLSGTAPSLSGARRAFTPQVPPALRTTVGEQLDWRSIPYRPMQLRAKWSASRSYASQLPRLRRWPLGRIALYEAVRRGETVGWLR